MKSLRFWVALVVAVAAAFAGGFLGGQTAWAHGWHCGGGEPACDRYYAVQGGPWTEGIKGHMFIETDMDLKDEAQDFVAHWMAVGNVLGEWVQIGFTDGVRPEGGSQPADTQSLYTETMTTCAGWGIDGYEYRDWEATSIWGTYKQVGVYRPAGSAVYCPGTQEIYQLYFYMKDGRAFWYGMMETTGGQVQAGTEHGNWTHHESNSLVCFGTSFTCDPTPGAGLHLYTQAGGWSLWTSAPWFEETNNLLYDHVQHGNYYSFITHRQ
ncbi:MAG: hypothetical protein WBF66_04625 [Dehalococcoidia bacterium]